MSYGTVQVEKMTTESGYSLGAGNASSFKNRIINGAMTIDQRNAGASVTFARGAGSYTTDRWNFFNGGTNNGNVTVQQDGVSSPTGFGFINSLKITNVTGGTAAAGDNLSFYQAIEGVNISDLSWGTSSAKPVTISFYVLCSSTGTFGVSARNSAANRSYVASFTVTTANTWQYVSVTIPGDTSGTWLTTNGVGIYLAFALGVGSTFQTTVGSWQAGNFFAVTGQTNLCTVSGAVFQITGVQLEVGTVATSFDTRSFGTEMALCQRYFTSNFEYGTAPSNSSLDNRVNNGTAFSASNIQGGPQFFPVRMRTAPTIVTYSPSFTSPAGSWGIFPLNWGLGLGVTPTTGNAYDSFFVPQFTVSGYTNGASYILSGYWTASAEL